MTDPSTASGNTTTVRFNVGGTMYEVSRSLLHQYPDTMLARLASDTWSTDKADDALFIERDGERFKYCLDYMRDGGIVNLPITVSKAAVLLDLEYYGFVNPDDSQISVNEYFSEYKAKLDFVDEIVRACCELGCMKFASYLIQKRKTPYDLYFEFYADDEFWDIAAALNQSESLQDLFNSHLKEYDLKLGGAFAGEHSYYIDLEKL